MGERSRIAEAFDLAEQPFALRDALSPSAFQMVLVKHGSAQLWRHDVTTGKHLQSDPFVDTSPVFQSQLSHDIRDGTAGRVQGFDLSEQR